MNDRQRLGRALLAGRACIAVQTVEEEEALQLVNGLAMDGGVEVSV